jgi:tRNA-binding EMAP/Myf-like protein
MNRYTLLACTLAVVAACNQGPPEGYAGGDTGLALARSKSAKDSLVMVKDSLLAEKDRQLSIQSAMIGDAATTARLISEIDADLAKHRVQVKDDKKVESGIDNASDRLATVQKKVNLVLSRLSASEARIRRMREDSVSRTMLNAQQAAQIAEYEKSIGDFRLAVESQSREIATLTAQVDSMGRENVALVARNNAMSAQEDSVFVAIGTEKELTEKGIIRREGGTLLLFGRGKTIVPARTLEMDDFQVISKSRDLSIQLPDSEKQYRIVSRQSLEFTDTSNPKEPLVKGALNVTDPQKFWAPSKYLILVQR